MEILSYVKRPGTLTLPSIDLLGDSPVLLVEKDSAEPFTNFAKTRFKELGIPRYTHSELLEASSSYIFYWEFKKEGERKFISFLINRKGNAYYSVSKTVRSGIKTLDEAIESFANDFYKA